MDIKQYEKENLPLLEKILQEFKEEDNEKKWFSDWYKNPKLLTNHRRKMFVAIDKGQMAGFIVGQPRSISVYKVFFLYVSPKYRGQRVAKALKNALVDYAVSEHYEAITSYAHIENTPSVGLNKRLGWEQKKFKSQGEEYIAFTLNLLNRNP